MTSIEIYSLAIGANLTFSTASMIYSYYARRFNSIWIGQVKVAIAFLAFMVAMLLSGEMTSLPWGSFGLLFISGLIGLCAGDIFLLRAFASLGAGRALVLFSFQPLMLGLYGYFFLGQIFTLNQTLAVICMIICIYLFMVERTKLTGSWDFRSFMWAFIAIILDALGIMLTRSAYEITPELETFQVNVIRCLGALAGFLLISPKSYVKIWKDIVPMKINDKLMLVGASVGGCFIALTLYLAALKHAHVGTLTAISITGPVWVSLLESLYQRKLPNLYLSGAFAFFILGFYLMAIA